MLHKFFIAQWERPSKLNEWTTQVKSDLIDFNIPAELSLLKSKSSNAFKELVKLKAKDYELQRLLKSKKSKMENLHYSKLEMQEYLELKEMNARQAKALFKFRVRMAPFGDNYKGGQDTPPCPLCKMHPDSQAESFQCEIMKELIQVKGDYSDIFGNYFSQELIQTIYSIYSFREELRKQN